MGDGDGVLWLAIAPSLAGWRPGQDLRPYLTRAMELYANKPWADGRPNALRANPVDASNGAGVAGQDLGLAIVPDARVIRGTFWLGQRGGAASETV